MSEPFAKCEVCRSLLDEEDLFCANCGTESPIRRQDDGTADNSARTATHNFECSGCGASMSYDANAGSLQCPFCASVDMVPRDDAKVLSPNRVVPFQIDRDSAVAAMRRWLGRGFFRPSDLAQQANVVKMQPVYVPYWVFRANTHTNWTADTSQTPAGARGDWYPLAGEHRGGYDGLLIGASGALTPSETSRLCPFDLASGVAPDGVDLENVTVEQFSVPRKYARPLARGALQQNEAAVCADRYVPGRSRNVHANVLIESMSGEPVLLPVYVMAYRYNDRLYRFLVNGQNGRSTGEAPRSLWKMLLIPAMVLVVLAAILLATRAFGAAATAETTTAREGWLGQSAAVPQNGPSGASLRSATSHPTGIDRSPYGDFSVSATTTSPLKTDVGSPRSASVLASVPIERLTRPLKSSRSPNATETSSSRLSMRSFNRTINCSIPPACTSIRCPSSRARTSTPRRRSSGLTANQ